MKVIYLPSGWNDDAFQEKLQQKLDEMTKEGYSYYDIKISSSGNHCMIIFKDKNH